MRTIGFLLCFISAATTWGQKEALRLDTLAQNLLKQGQYPEALLQSNAALEAATLDSILAQAYNTNASILENMGEYERAETQYLHSQQLRLKAFGENSHQYALSLTNIAALYGKLGSYARAELLYTQAIQTYTNALGSEHFTIAFVKNNLADLYIKMQRFEEAEPLYTEALKTIEITFGKNSTYYATLLNNLAAAYRQTNRPKEALPLLLEAVHVFETQLGKDHPNTAAIQLSLATIYQQLNDYPKAENILTTNLTTIKTKLGTNHPNYANALIQLSLCYKNQHLWDKAIKTQTEALAARRSTLPEKHTNIISSLNELANIQKLAGQLDLSLKTYWEAIATNSLSPSAPASREDIAKNEFTSYQLLLQSVSGIQDLYFQKHLQNPNAQDLQESRLFLATGLNINDRIRNDFNLEKSKLRSLEQNGTMVANLLDRTIRLHNYPLDVEAFGYAEKNKSILLADATRAQRARSLSNIPEALTQQELSLQRQSDKLQKAFGEANNKESKDSLRSLINALQIEINTFTTNLQKQYPKYYQLRYASSSTSAAEVQKQLAADAMLIEYFAAADYLYVFGITKDSVVLLQLDLPLATLKKNVETLRNNLTGYDLLVQDADLAYKEFTAAASASYAQFLAPILAHAPKNIRHLHIVTDNELGHLPFEAFLTAPAKGETYNELPYLLNKYKLSYHYSATLWQECQAKATSAQYGAVLAVAAHYSPKGRQATQRTAHLRQLRKLLGPLPQAQQEVLALAKSYEGLFLIDSTQTTERLFKQQAGDYEIIHLAMHGLLDANSPMLSALAFTEDGDTLEDNFLEAWEIARLPLRAKLVVLSACETGYGKFQQGEGVLSLSRSFMYAGVPSLVVSLWQVNDQTTAIIMTNFYAELAKGKDKAEALQAAKLQYIKNTTGYGAHPAFWAPFVQVGDDSPIIPKQKGGLPWLWVGLACGGIVLVGIGLWSRRRSRRAA